jgi:outer membrane protein insertion porin family
MILSGNRTARSLLLGASQAALFVLAFQTASTAAEQVPPAEPVQPPAAVPVAPPGDAPAAPGAVAAPPIQGVVRDIVVEGTQRVEPESVLSYMSLREGQPYDPVAADDSLKVLFETGLFADVRLNWDGQTLTVRVVENPIINQVVFEGNDELSNEDLEREVQVRPRMVFTRARVQADVQRIIELYRRSGHFAATVEPKIVQRPQNRVDLVFEINEGPTTGVASINFIGNRVFSDGELRDQIVTVETAWWRFLSTNDNYDPDRLTFDREQLRRFYLSRGYADFHVISAVAELAPDRRNFYITFTIEEGERYNFGKIEIQSAIRDLNPADLMPLIEARTGDVYNAQTIDDSVEALTFAAGTRGFVFIDIRPRVTRNRETRTIDLIFQIEEAPRVYVERINITGNVRTRDEVIRREFRLVEGDAFNRVLVDRSRTRARALGFFREVTITEEPGTQADRTVLNVAVTEQPTGELSLGAGYSSTSNLIGEFSYTERNLFGRGQFLRASISYSDFQQQYDLRFTEPYFMGRPLQAGFLLYKIVTDFTDYAGYIQDTTAFGLLFGFPVSEYGTISPHYNYQIVNLDVSPTAPLSVQLSAGKASTSSIGYSYVYNTIDDPQLPRNGWIFTLNQDLAGLGGDLNYFRTIAGVDFYQPWEIFGSEFVGSLSFSAGYIAAYGGQNLRITERFFRGGPTFRGFELAGMGPRDIASRERPALGGQLFLMNTFQVRLPPIIPETYGIRLSLFNDFGTLGYLRGVSKVCDMDGSVIVDPVTGQQTFTSPLCVQDTLAPRASAGLSINWRSPFGPVSIDIGYPYLSEPYDRVQAIRFSTSTNFQ